MDKLDKMDTFLETYNLPILNQEESENLNKHMNITTNESETVLKKLPTNKSPVLDGFIGIFYQILRTYTSPSQTIPKNSRGETPKLIL